MFKGYALSVRGASHEEDNTPCQDSARFFIGDDFAVAAVSDGHGSEKHFRSASGSEMATRVAIRSICDFHERNHGLDGIFTKDCDETARRIAANIICGWNSEIAAHLSLLPLDEKEKAICNKYGGISGEIIYGATLIIGVVTKRVCFGLQIGDGSFCANTAKDGMIFPVPEDAKLVGNQTTSLCDNDAIGNFRHFCYEGKLSGIMLSSDGLINSFRNEEDFLKFGRRVLDSVDDGTASKLGEHLKIRSRTGSRDDISVAAITVH